MGQMTSADLEPPRTAPSFIGPTGALQALAQLERRALRQLWRELIGSPVPPKASQSLLRYGLAYRIQEKAYGGLSTAARMRLGELAGQLAAAKPVPTRVPPGTRLIRQWREERHEVTVLERGYAYRGSRYTSLSAIACLISGTHCSGPRFFGLKSSSTAKFTAANGFTAADGP
jgi:hypothetical protein